jgi:hypothetical protein
METRYRTREKNWIKFNIYGCLCLSAFCFAADEMFNSAGGERSIRTEEEGNNTNPVAFKLQPPMTPPIHSFSLMMASEKVFGFQHRRQQFFIGEIYISDISLCCACVCVCVCVCVCIYTKVHYLSKRGVGRRWQCIISVSVCWPQNKNPPSPQQNNDKLKSCYFCGFARRRAGRKKNRIFYQSAKS